MKNAFLFPGQGSQYRGMGKGLFSKNLKETQLASDILGYDLKELCLTDPKRQLRETQFAQPALYVVNHFFYKKQRQIPSYLAGHSLGEYNALLAAGVFDFETGLRLVKKRGELMMTASGGGMAAVLGINEETLKLKLDKGGYSEIDIANLNTSTQIVVSGPQDSIKEFVKEFDNNNIKIIPLFVTAAFHSRYMQRVAKEFAIFLKDFNFSPLQIPVISNVTALPYKQNQISTLLSKQITSPVNWINTIRFLMGKDIDQYEEINSTILIKMVNEIKENCKPIFEENPTKMLEKERIYEKIDTSKTTIAESSQSQKNNGLLSTHMGSKAFRDCYNVGYAYVAGAMYRGIASKELVVRMGKAKMLSFLGTGGMTLEEIEDNIQFIQRKLKDDEIYGMNIVHDIIDPKMEMSTIKLYLKYNIQIIEAAAFMHITPSLVYYRLQGLRKDANDIVICDHHIMAKVSRPEVAEVFMRPAPERIVNKLYDQGYITQEQVEMSKKIPMSQDICVEADSGGHTDGGVAMVLLPSIQSLRKKIQKEFIYRNHIRIGLAGGIGTPQAIASSFIMGADFVLTGSINQCTVEAGTSNVVKDLLQEVNIQDTDYAPAGDMFEVGAKVQVLKKGVLFPARANKLYRLYQQYNSLEEIPEKIIAQLEKSYFKKQIVEIWSETKDYWISKGELSLIKEAEQNPKKKMALVFRWYFGYSLRLSFDGDIKEKVNFQVHTGPALGAFNQWVKGTELENWKNRHVDTIGIKMMEEASTIMKTNINTN